MISAEQHMRDTIARSLGITDPLFDPVNNSDDALTVAIAGSIKATPRAGHTIAQSMRFPSIMVAEHDVAHDSDPRRAYRVAICQVALKTA